MDSRNIRSIIGAGLLIGILVAACGPAEPTATPTPQPLSLASHLTAEPTDAGPAAEAVSPTIEVTFDGSQCTVEGPAELPTGRHTISLRDLSGQHVGLWVGLLLEGKSYQDLLDLQTEPGAHFPISDWVVHPRQMGFRQTEDGAAVHTFVLSEAGEHVIYLGTTGQLLTLWLCPPLKVVEAH